MLTKINWFSELSLQRLTLATTVLVLVLVWVVADLTGGAAGAWTALALKPVYTPHINKTSTSRLKSLRPVRFFGLE
jgi:hypothetical protein